MTFTEEEINNIIGLKGYDGRQIDIFNLYGIIFVGNTEKSSWNLNRNFVKLSESRVPITIDAFEFCETEKDVRETFAEELKESITEKVL